MKIFIPKNMLCDEDVNGYHLLAYSHLRLLMSCEEIDEYCINLDSLVFSIYGTLNVGKRIRENIYNSMNWLIDSEFLSGYKVNRTCYVIKTESIFFNSWSTKFVILNYSDIKKIMLSKSNIKLQLFRYYVFLMSTLNGQITVYLENGQCKNNIIGNQTQNYLALIANISPDTVIRYNSLLEDLNVIYIYRFDDFLKTGNNGIRHIRNLYGRYENKEYIQKYAEEYKKHNKSYKYTSSRTETANKGRKLSKMYYWLCQGKSDKYSESEIKQIYKYIIDFNQKCKNLANKENDEKYLENIKDIEVFKQFDYLSLK